ncbi:hypothetical protein KIL84_004085 [Mauremys mutica]|uniref:Uncharacterized protein n=1 Tax=Mauremys mutica TaxID=74926 RepID=A0A9D4B5Y6_9SAUR|nr:hypothetical protein KIL84_004085 [Mauremys mutica]
MLVSKVDFQEMGSQGAALLVTQTPFSPTLFRVKMKPPLALLLHRRFLSTLSSTEDTCVWIWPVQSPSQSPHPRLSLEEMAAVLHWMLGASHQTLQGDLPPVSGGK